MKKIEIKNLTKIFGKNTNEGLKRLKKGQTKEEIFKETGMTVGVNQVDLDINEGELFVIMGLSGSGDSDIMMTDTINPLKSKFKGFHKTFKQDDLGLSLSSFLLN